MSIINGTVVDNIQLTNNKRYESIIEQQRNNQSKEDEIYARKLMNEEIQAYNSNISSIPIQTIPIPIQSIQSNHLIPIINTKTRVRLQHIQTGKFLQEELIIYFLSLTIVSFELYQTPTIFLNGKQDLSLEFTNNSSNNPDSKLFLFESTPDGKYLYNANGILRLDGFKDINTLWMIIPITPGPTDKPIAIYQPIYSNVNNNQTQVQSIQSPSSTSQYTAPSTKYQNRSRSDPCNDCCDTLLCIFTCGGSLTTINYSNGYNNNCCCCSSSPAADSSNCDCCCCFCCCDC